MNAGKIFRKLDWGHLLFLLFLLSAAAWYLFDTWEASSRTRNLILVLPASIVALALTIGLIVATLMTALSATEDSAPAQTTKAKQFYPLVLITLFGSYILTIPTFGFDLGSALFVFLVLIIDGERRIGFLLIYPAAFALLVTMIFGYLLPYPMHTLLL